MNRAGDQLRSTRRIAWTAMAFLLAVSAMLAWNEKREAERAPGRQLAGPDIDYHTAWITLVAGSGISLVVFFLLRSRALSSARAQRMAEELTDEIRHGEAALRESEFRWRFAVDGPGDGMWDWNIPESTVYFSRRWKEMLGYTEDEIGDGLAEWSGRIHPADHAATMADVDAYLSGASQEYQNEHRVRCKNGDYKWILDRGMVVHRAHDGTPLRMIGTHKDITDRRELEDGLRRQGAELIEAQRIAKLGGWTLDLASGRTTWTPELYTAFGLDPDLPPPNFEQHPELFTPESWASLSAAVAQAAARGVPYELELECIRPDGTTMWMLAKGEPIHDDDGVAVGLRGITMDVTERRRSMVRAEVLGQLYKALSECNSAVVQSTDQKELFSRVCEVVAAVPRIGLAWIGITDDATGEVRVAAASGEGIDYLDGILVLAGDHDPHGFGPTGTAIRECRPVWEDDFAAAPTTAPWHERGADFHWAASAAVPIRRNGGVIGALTIYSVVGGWMDVELRRLMEEMAHNIGAALDKFAAQAEAEQYQRTLIESEQRFESLVSQSIAGAYIIQDGLVVYANPRLRHLLGIEPDADLTEVAASEFFAPTEFDRLSIEWDELVTGAKSSVEATLMMRRRDGSTFDAGLSASLATYLGHTATVGLVHDVTSRAVAEARISRYAQQLETTFMQIVELATTLGEMRDPYTVGHEQRVAKIAVAIAQELGIDDPRIDGIRVSGYLHDVGKIGVPAEILVKPSTLSDLEWAMIRQHPRFGYDILRKVEFPWPVADVALQHHERIDGSGYPEGLMGDAILIEARIIAVADVIESMASHRPYRPSLGVEAALTEIEDHRGTLFDAEVVDACLRVFRERNFQLDVPRS